jgi:hypothetical protein
MPDVGGEVMTYREDTTGLPPRASDAGPEEPPITDEDEMRGAIADAAFELRKAENEVDPLPRLLMARYLIAEALAYYFFGGGE